MIFANRLDYMKDDSQCPNLSTTPITAMGCRQCLPLSVVHLKGKHWQKPHCRNGIVDTFGQKVLKVTLTGNRPSSGTPYCCSKFVFKTSCGYMVALVPLSIPSYPGVSWGVPEGVAGGLKYHDFWF